MSVFDSPPTLPKALPPWVVAAICFLWLASPTAFAQIHHDLTISLDPQQHRLTVIDTITLPAAHQGDVRFQLHKGLKPMLRDKGLQLKQLPTVKTGQQGDMDPALADHPVPVEEFIISVPDGTQQFTLQYGGKIHHPIKQHGEEYARSFSISPGLISAEGVFLASASYWYPSFDNQLMTFRLQVKVPTGWRAITQGQRLESIEQKNYHQATWSIGKPQEEIYLVAARFTEYRQQVGNTEAMVFLRQSDPALAQKYLDATHRYLTLYRQLLGDYPYQKFALVENFWETGYGMPSFTLLGPKVIRFPFILHSSYPHEILHNWWGNGVYVDYDRGNWAEGLTTYLADHLIKEQKHQAVAYRRTTLQGYSNYVRDQSDFPLTEFRGRHSSVTQAVGYGKTLFLFHMLRRELGDEAFIAALRDFYQQHRFTRASFADIEKVFSKHSPRPLGNFFQQWVRRSGAPTLRVQHASSKANKKGYQLTFTLTQTQKGTPYRLRIPVAVHMHDKKFAHQQDIVMSNKQQRFSLTLPARPLQLEIDPEFDVFRRLHHNEIPATLSQAFGAERVLIVIPARTSKQQQQAYRDVAKAWQKGHDRQIEIRLDNTLSSLPSDRMVWLFGWENRFHPELNTALSGYAFKDNNNHIVLNDNILQRAQHSVVVLARHPTNPQQAIAWLASDNTAALPGLARKLPHYGKYSYLGFQGDEPTNIVKGQWPVIDSPMSVAITQTDGKNINVKKAKLQTRPPLIQPAPQFSKQRMVRDIQILAARDMAGRGLGTTELDRAAEYIAKQFRAAGLQPVSDSKDSYFQSWAQQIPGRPHKDKLKNVIAILPGSNAKFTQQSVVIAAHYDHLGRGWPDVHQGDEGKIHPGADDNASGVAVLLELARHFAKQPPPQRSLVFIAFSGEEAGRLGSKYYVEHAGNYPIDKVIGMINLDTVGRLNDRNLLVLGSGSAYEWPHIFRGAGYVTGVNIKPVADDPGGSDQVSFLHKGVPAVQIFAGAHGDYHRPGDTSDKIDSNGLAKITAVIKEAIEYLTARTEPLRVTLGQRDKTDGKPSTTNQQGRKVRLGTVPDFAFAGPGVRLTDVTEDTPAARAGLKANDVIVQINTSRIENLRDFGKVLRTLDPGDAVTIHFLRDGTRQSVETKTEAR